MEMEVRSPIIVKTVVVVVVMVGVGIMGMAMRMIATVCEEMMPILSIVAIHWAVLNVA